MFFFFPPPLMPSTGAHQEEKPLNHMPALELDGDPQQFLQHLERMQQQDRDRKRLIKELTAERDVAVAANKQLRDDIDALKSRANLAAMQSTHATVRRADHEALRARITASLERLERRKVAIGELAAAVGHVTDDHPAAQEQLAVGLHVAGCTVEDAVAAWQTVNAADHARLLRAVAACGAGAPAETLSSYATMSLPPLPALHLKILKAMVQDPLRLRVAEHAARVVASTAATRSASPGHSTG